MLANTGSSRRGEFNIRFGQPSTNILRAPGNTYPFAYKATPEPALDENRGLLDRSRADGSMPKVIATNSGMEYWWSGASLGHTTVDGARDLEPPHDVRIYYLSGAQHGPGALPLSNRNPDGFLAKQPLNTLDYRPAMRALLTALDEWVREDIVPPESRVPRIDEATAVSRESLEAQYTRIPGSAWLSHLPQRLRMDFGPDASSGLVRYPPVESGTYPVLVSSMDEDCNNVAGIRLPDVAVPLATYTGWNVRHEEMGQGGLMTSGAPLFGSTLVFPRTRAEREASGDPRKAIDERYASKEDYLARVRAAAETLVRERYLLAEDIEPVVAVAGQKWDAFRGGTSRAKGHVDLFHAKLDARVLSARRWNLERCTQRLHSDPAPLTGGPRSSLMSAASSSSQSGAPGNAVLKVRGMVTQSASTTLAPAKSQRAGEHTKADTRPCPRRAALHFVLLSALISASVLSRPDESARARKDLGLRRHILWVKRAKAKPAVDSRRRTVVVAAKPLELEDLKPGIRRHDQGEAGWRCAGRRGTSPAFANGGARRHAVGPDTLEDDQRQRRNRGPVFRYAPAHPGIQRGLAKSRGSSRYADRDKYACRAFGVEAGRVHIHYGAGRSRRHDDRAADNG